MYQQDACFQRYKTSNRTCCCALDSVAAPRYRRAPGLGGFQRGDNLPGQIRAIVGAGDNQEFDQLRHQRATGAEVQLHRQEGRRGRAQRLGQRRGEVHRSRRGQIRRPAVFVARIEDARRRMLGIP